VNEYNADRRPGDDVDQTAIASIIGVRYWVYIEYLEQMRSTK